MYKKITAVLAVISALSIFCFGFASWNINYSTSREVNLTGMNFIVDEATIIQDKGISYDLTKYPPTGFTYIKEENTNYSFSATNLTLTITIDKSILTSLPFDDLNNYYLHYQFYYFQNRGSSKILNFVTSNDYLTPPTKLICMSRNLENVRFEVNNLQYIDNEKEIDTTKNMYMITANIPIKSSTEKSLYNIVSMDNKDNIVPINIILPFSNPTALLESSISVLGLTNFCYSLSIQDKKLINHCKEG